MTSSSLSQFFVDVTTPFRWVTFHEFFFSFAHVYVYLQFRCIFFFFFFLCASLIFISFFIQMQIIHIYKNETKRGIKRLRKKWILGSGGRNRFFVFWGRVNIMITYNVASEFIVRLVTGCVHFLACSLVRVE